MLSNGHVYQFSLSLFERGFTLTLDNLIEYLAFNNITSITDVIDLHGETQTAIDQIHESSSDESMKLDNYKRQESPHFIIGTSDRDISVFLAGVNVRLYHKKMNTNIVHSQIIKYSGKQHYINIKHNDQCSQIDVVCLSLLLNNGKLSLYTLPSLDFLLEMNVPNQCLLDRLQEASLSSDGRIVYWSGKYELEQYSFLHKPDL